MAVPLLGRACTDNNCSDEISNTANKRDGVMIRLLDSCIRLLADQGMSKLLVDAVKGGGDGFQSMGECFPRPAARAEADSPNSRLPKVGKIQRCLA